MINPQFSLGIYAIIVCAIFFGFVLEGCNTHRQKPKIENCHLVIGISFNNPERSCENWLKDLDSSCRIIDISKVSTDSIQLALKSCNGILLTGGCDIDPGRYGKGDEIRKCGITSLKRDVIDSILVAYAFKYKVPILGICRGEQFLNIAKGGELFTDVPTDVGMKVIHRSKENGVCYHPVSIAKGSLLNRITQITHGTVNSIHHQGIAVIAPCFKPAAVTEDGLIESIELNDSIIQSDSNRFALGVQWHPELLDKNHLLSRPIGLYFLRMAKQSIQ